MDLDDLETSVRFHRRAAVAFIAVVLLGYAGRFLLDPNACLGSSAEPWGQFGDFVGGLLNPVIAFLAFYWLTQSVLIQKRELNETKTALVESAQSQTRQVVRAERAARINALGSILDSKNAELAHMRHSFEAMSHGAQHNGWAHTPEGDWIGGSRLNDYIAEYRDRLAQSEREQVELIAKLQQAIDSDA